MAVKASDQMTVMDITDGYTIMLSLDAVSLNGGISTLETQQSVTVNVTAYKGADKIVPTVNAPTCPTNVSASVGSAVNSAVPVIITFAAALASAGKERCDRCYRSNRCHRSYWCYRNSCIFL